jgi:hypothetical protein
MKAQTYIVKITPKYIDVRWTNEYGNHHHKEKRGDFAFDIGWLGGIIGIYPAEDREEER